ncbi:MAG: type II toxin-antitoxin system RelE/ParE family toxin [Alphaproteobacteria bacterium]|nr:type II toxin-antitoxin system RelE/ParE family toxin [Alphaproteobacteria bacterium]
MPAWRVHRLSGDRSDEWSLSVTRYWRIIFSIDQQTREIVNLDFEDHH